MKKQLIFCIVLICIFFHAQSQVRESRTTIDTNIRVAVLIESDLNGSETENAIESYFDSMHIKKEKGKGFIIKKSLGYLLFKRAKVEGVSDVYDFYFVVENRKQKGDDAATIYIAVSKGVNNFLSPENDKEAWSQVKDFAAFMQNNYLEQYKLNTKLAALIKDLDKKRKKLDDVLKEKYELETGINSDSLQTIDLQEQLMKLKVKKQ